MSNSFPTFQKRSYLAYADKVALTEFMSHCRHFRLGDAARVAYWWCASEGWRLSPMRIRESRATRLFDRKHGTDTSTRVELSALQIDSDNRDRGVYYQASPVLSTQRVLRQLDIDFENFTFIDFGSGKGRIILLASDLPFREVLGVEFSPELHECAQRNISQYCWEQQRPRSIDLQ